MKEASRSYKGTVSSGGNIDDCGEPYQTVRRTSSQGDRKRICSDVRKGLQKFTERAYGLELLDEERFDELENKLASMS